MADAEHHLFEHSGMEHLCNKMLGREDGICDTW